MGKKRDKSYKPFHKLRKSAKDYDRKNVREEDVDSDTCPECLSPLRGDVWSGVKCSKCPYWFCF